MIVRSDALRLLSKLRTDEVVISTMTTVPEWKALSNNYPLDFALVGAMSQGPSMALGLALAHPERKIWMLNGDGSQLMNLGNLASLVHNGVKNVVIFVMENGCYEMVGGQPIPLSGRISFEAVARSLGIADAHTFADFRAFESQIAGILKGEGPTFVVLKVEPGEKFPKWLPKKVDEGIKLKKALAEGV